MFDFERNSAKQVQEVLEKLDANKASGYDVLPIKIRNDWGGRTSLPTLGRKNDIQKNFMMKCALKKSSLILCAFLWGKKAFVLKTIQSGVVFIKGKKRNYIRH